MDNKVIQKLQSINDFPELVEYLRDELDWPIETDHFDDLTFEYTAEELGIDEDNAAKILEIKRLRPLDVDQPWGIFFVRLEPKRLPVVALRRLLSKVAIKKRASANQADQVAWNADDILFISSFGDHHERQLSFAHFAVNKEKKDLPILKVLGWDSRDTRLHIDDVVQTLKEKLSWPEDTSDSDAWRTQWRKAFSLRHGEVITTSKEMAVRLAVLARAIRDRIRSILDIENEKGSITLLMNTFKTALVHDLNEDGFADMYAQTIAYGLLSARIANPSENTAEGFTECLPVTNPFLKELMETFLHVGGRVGNNGKGIGLDFDELGVSDVVELLDTANMEAVVRDFGDRNPLEDPVIHFYELFLKEYDAAQKMQRGVFYTPRPVVSFIVRSVDELLRSEFGLEDGLASTTTWREMAGKFHGLEIPVGVIPDQTFVQILDPATGTGTFLVEVISLIHKTMTGKWQAQGNNKEQIDKLWNNYVPEHLLPRLHGYELMMAPYAIAHMKIGLKLFETGYHFGNDERVRIFLTSALEPPQDFSDRLAFAIPALAHEAEAVNAIKENQMFTVVIGNPPYSINSCNLQESAVQLVESFRYVDGAKIRERGALKFETILQDDYIKFWGLGIRLLEQTPLGIISMISNNGFLTNRVLRGVRWTFLNKFTHLTFLDLHGNRSKREVCPDGSDDENVFEINQGVGISVLSKTKTAPRMDEINLADLWGTRDLKYRKLSDSTEGQIAFTRYIPKAPNYLFVIADEDIENEYRALIALDEAMPFNKAGFVSGRDAFAVDLDHEPLEKRINDFLDPKNSDTNVRERFSIKDAGGYNLAGRRKPALEAKLSAKDIICRVQHRPFDYRFVAYSEAVLTSPQKAAMRHLLGGENIAFCLSRGAEIIRGWEHIFCTRAIVQHHTVSLKEVNYVFPLEVLAEDNSLEFGSDRSPNFSNHFLQTVAARLKLSINDVSHLPSGLSAKDIFHYVYAIFYCPTYRSRYAEFLKTDFPRLPLTGNLDLFRELARLGSEMSALHLLDSPKLSKLITTVLVRGPLQVEKVSYSNETVWLDTTKTKGFQGVSEEVWNYHIGGYQVCEKWLKDRQTKGGKNPHPGRVLTDEDIEHYQKIIVAISETICIMGEIDEVIATHGGWHDAFVTGDTVNG